VPALISILLVEDDPLDAELIAERLAADGLICRVSRIEERTDLAHALDRGCDLVLSDFHLPKLDGVAALAMARTIRPEVPVIIISGAIGEEMAVELMRQGATDCVLKDRLERLAPSVRRALKETEERAARRRAEAERDFLLLREREARRDAEEANRLKDEFLAMVSHELRTPLTSMLGWLRLLCTGGVPPERTTHALEAVARGARAQAQLVDDLLDVSRIVTGKLHLDDTPVQVLDVLEAALDAVRPLAAAKTLKVTVHAEPATVRGDGARLQQVVWNLLTNAVKFTPAGGEITVSLFSTDGSAVISVVDTGVGIPPEFMPQVFERFRQADSSLTRKHGGLGLGLAIVRHLVERHGGTIEADSAGETLGSRFTVRIPLALGARVAPPGPIADGTGHLRGMTVLLVEDDADARELLTTILEGYGARVTAVASVCDALLALDESCPDVLVSDIGMPGEDGYSLIKKVRARNVDIPAVALTAFARHEDQGRALSAGFQLHIAKPIDPAVLASALVKVSAAR
jgi:signal transduction histidine kinase